MGMSALLLHVLIFHYIFLNQTITSQSIQKVSSVRFIRWIAGLRCIQKYLKVKLIIYHKVPNNYNNFLLNRNAKYYISALQKIAGQYFLRKKMYFRLDLFGLIGNEQFFDQQIPNFMTPQQHKKFQQSLKQTQQRTARTLLSIDATLSGVKDTLQKIKQNQENIQKFKQDYNKVMTNLAKQIAFAMNVDPNMKGSKKPSDDKPTERPVKDVVKSMLAYKQILIITGAGVSAPSGIPTFRGQNGLYGKKFEWQGEEYEPQQFITKHFYDRHPEAIWRWIQQIYKMATNLKPNTLHQLIDKLAKVLSARGKKVTIVTQNIDDFHYKPTKDEYKYYAIHGNVKQVRCINNHLHPYTDFRKTIVESGKEAECPNCKEALRPHVLFFDEKYGPLYGGEVKEKQFPFVIVIGSSLSTGLCHRLSYRAQEVVQINPNPVIQVGKVYQFKGKTDQTLKGFLKQMGEMK